MSMHQREKDYETQSTDHSEPPCIYFQIWLGNNRCVARSDGFAHQCPIRSETPRFDIVHPLVGNKPTAFGVARLKRVSVRRVWRSPVGQADRRKARR